MPIYIDICAATFLSGINGMVMGAFNEAGTAHFCASVLVWLSAAYDISVTFVVVGCVKKIEACSFFFEGKFLSHHLHSYVLAVNFKVILL